MRDVVVALAKRSGVASDKIYIYDGSKQSNCYTDNVSGLGQGELTSPTHGAGEVYAGEEGVGRGRGRSWTGWSATPSSMPCCSGAAPAGGGARRRAGDRSAVRAGAGARQGAWNLSPASVTEGAWGQENEQPSSRSYPLRDSPGASWSHGRGRSGPTPQRNTT